MTMDVIITAVISLISALIGFGAAWIVMQYQFKEAKRHLCIEMYQEFDSIDMLQSRFEAGKLLSEARNAKSQVLLEQLYQNEETRPGYLHLAKVLRFWERLSVMVVSKRIDVALAKDIFTYDYQNWKKDYLQYCKAERYQTLERISRLDQYLSASK